MASLSKRMTLKNQSTFNRIMIGFWSIPAEQNTSSSVRHYQSLSCWNWDCLHGLRIEILSFEMYRFVCSNSHSTVIMRHLIPSLYFCQRPKWLSNFDSLNRFLKTGFSTPILRCTFKKKKNMSMHNRSANMEIIKGSDN